MKKTLIAVIALLAVLSCAKKLTLPDEPSNVDDGRTEVTASVADYASNPFVWSSATKVGIYDTAGHSNQRYTLKNEFDGKTGEVSLYGSTIGGSAVAYLPFTVKGYACVADRRQPVLPVQKAGDSALEHLSLNAILIAQDSGDGHFSFSYENGNSGILHLTLKCPVDGLVDKVVLTSPDAPLAGNVSILADADPLVTDGSSTLTLADVGRPSSEESPLEVWAQVPSGKFTHLTVTVVGGGRVMSAPIDGVLTVAPGGSASAVAEASAFVAGNEDFTIIDGSYQ